jgi:hypothetical protein
MNTSTSKSFAESLRELADDLTAKHSREGAISTPPPLVAAQSPIHELLIEEIAASVPQELALKLRASRTVAQAHDWIAAGAMYTWIKTNSSLAGLFLQELGDRPDQAALVLAKTFARTLDPPPPDPRAPAWDRLGIAIQGVVATLMLGVRGLVFVSLLSLATGRTWSLELPGRLVTAIALPDLVWLEAPAAPLAAMFALACGSGWLLLDCICMPRWLRYCRSLPLRRLAPRVYSDWRIDSIPVLWCAHAVVLQFIFAAKTLQLAVRSQHLLWVYPVGRAVIYVSALVALTQAIAAIRYLKAMGPREHPVQDQASV